MTRKKNFTLALLVITSAAFAQTNDSLSLKKKPERPQEIGFSVSSVFFFLAGVSDVNERYTNLTYRYLFTEKQAVKLFAGASLFNAEANKFEQTILPSIAQTTLYATTEKKTPSNFQLGIGYEYILGKGRLKHVIGLDLLYNNKFESEKFYYLLSRDSINPDGMSLNKITRLDSGAVTKTKNYDKFGLNLNYTLRYAISKKWVVTTGLFLSYRNYKGRDGNKTYRINDMDIHAIISDVSLFYKF